MCIHHHRLYYRFEQPGPKGLMAYGKTIADFFNLKAHTLYCSLNDPGETPADGFNEEGVSIFACDKPLSYTLLFTVYVFIV